MWLTNTNVCDFNIFHVYGQALSSKVCANVCVIYIFKLVFCHENDTALWGILAIYRVIFGYYNVVGGCGQHLVGRDPSHFDSLWNKKKNVLTPENIPMFYCPLLQQEMFDYLRPDFNSILLVNSKYVLYSFKYRLNFP